VTQLTATPSTIEALRWCRSIRRRPVRAAKVARNIVDRDRLRDRRIRCATAESDEDRQRH